MFFSYIFFKDFSTQDLAKTYWWGKWFWKSLHFITFYKADTLYFIEFFFSLIYFLYRFFFTICPTQNIMFTGWKPKPETKKWDGKTSSNRLFEHELSHTSWIPWHLTTFWIKFQVFTKFFFIILQFLLLRFTPYPGNC